MAFTLGLISDTHGLLRAEALAALQGVDHLCHLGDIGKPEILEQLRAIAPLDVVRGNNDRADWADSIPVTKLVQFEGIKLYLIHDLKELKLYPPPEPVQVVLSGHSHKPLIRQDHEVLYLNPGSAGPRRFKLPISVGFLEIRAGTLVPRLQELAL